MNQTIDKRRIAVFLLFAFGIAWTTGLVIFLTGGIANNPLALPLTVLGYMGAPAMAHLLTRLVTREGWHELYLRPRFRHGWPYWLICWVGPGLLTIAGMIVFFLIMPQYFDPALGTVQKLLKSAGNAATGVNPWTVVIAQTVQAILIAPLLNGLPTLGEEFGWRAYLQPKLMPLGGRKAMLIIGVIWGVWHWPIIAMGHNYGLNYPGYPWLGMLMMVWFTFLLGTFLGWATLRGGSVWPAVIGHGAINGIAALGVLLEQGQPSTLLGPLPVGLIGSVGFAIVALLIYISPSALRPAEPAPTAEVAPAPAVATSR
jgi:membrane protease YdiL (CAAX protease family)